VDRTLKTPHRIVSVDELAPPRGFAHAVVAAPGQTVYLGGQTAHGSDGVIRGATVVEQFCAAAANVVRALAAAGAEPPHLVSLQIFVTDLHAYQESLEEIGSVYRAYFGRHYPAMALFEVASLFDPKAIVELVGVAVVPDQR
jgi:enamine deaminase RidA (YjgF/YER057c/UK114 family)